MKLLSKNAILQAMAQAVAPPEDEDPLFPKSLPPWAVRSTGWVIVALFGVALIGSLVVKVPETVRSPFVLLPSGGTDPIQSPVSGMLESSRIAEGQSVEKGETLFVIRSHEIIDRSSELYSIERDLAGFRQQEEALSIEVDAEHQAAAAEMRRLTLREKQLSRELDQAMERQKLSREHFEVSMRIQRSTIEQGEREVEFRRKNHEAGEGILKSMQSLRSEGIVSPIQLLSHELAVSQSALELDSAERELAKARLMLEQMKANRENELAEEALSINRLKTEHQETLAELEKLTQETRGREASSEERQRALLTEIEKATARVSALRKGLEDSDENLWRVIAPFGGIVVAVAKKNPGEVIQGGQELCQIARADGELRVEIMVPEDSIAKLKPGQPVKLFLKAFPYQRYGAKRAVLTWVSPGAVASADGQSFPAIAELQDEAVQVGDVSQPLRPGMQGEARIVAGRRTLFGFVMEPIRRLRESMSSGESEK